MSCTKPVSFTFLSKIFPSTVCLRDAYWYFKVSSGYMSIFWLRTAGVGPHSASMVQHICIFGTSFSFYKSCSEVHPQKEISARTPF